MIVLQIGPTYQTCINFAEKLMVLRCYDHNLITDRKRRLWILSGLFSVAFYENAAVSILRTAITLTRPTLHLCHKQSRLYFPLAFRTRPRWSLGFVQGIAAGACALQLPATTTRTVDSIHARAIIGRKRGQAGIGTKLVGVKLLNTLQQVSKLTSTNWPIKMRDYPNHSGKMLQEWNRRLCVWCWR